MAVIIRLLKGKRTALMTGSRTCLPIARGVGGGLQRVTRDHPDPHAEGRTREGKNASSLKGVAKKALEVAVAWALSLLGAAWRILETASSWSGAQGDLARMLRRHRIGEIGQAMMETGQKGRETSPESLKRDETGSKEGSCRPEEKQVKPVGTGARQDVSGSPLKKPSVIRKKIIGSQDAGLVQKDEPENSPRTHKSVPKGGANYEKFRTQEYDTICKENNVKQKGKSPTQDDGFVEKVEETVGPPKSLTQQLIKERGAGKAI